MKKVWQNIHGFFKETFTGLTFREAGAALRDTGRDVLKSRREALTLAVFCFASPVPGSVAAFLLYRLHLYRAKTGKIDKAPEPLLSDARVAAIKQMFTGLPKRVGRAVFSATPLALKTTGAAVALSGAGLSTYATVQVVRTPSVMNYSVLRACNEAMRRGDACTREGTIEKAKSTRALTNLGLFAGGGGIALAGAGLFAAAGRRRK